MNATAYKPKQFRLKDMPEDVYKILLKTQMEIKLQCNCQFSLEQTMYKIVRQSVKKEKHDPS